MSTCGFQTREAGAAAVLFGLADAEFGLASDFQHAGLAERLEEAVEEDLGLPLLVAGDVGLDPFGELLEAVAAWGLERAAGLSVVYAMPPFGQHTLAKW